mgnify:CR=1 FL=1
MECCQLSFFDLYDERVLNGMKKTDWNNFRFIDLFAGIGGIRLGFESVGGHCVFSSEFQNSLQSPYLN